MRSAVLASPETATALKRFADLLPGDRVRHLWLACLCCPGAADLPGQIRALAGDAGADRIFVDLPVSGAIGLIAEFDVQKPWRREIVVCLSAAWSASRRQGRLSPYQCRLIRVADSVVHVSPNLSKPGSEVLN